jgi:hypothetical protein
VTVVKVRVGGWDVSAIRRAFVVVGAVAVFLLMAGSALAQPVGVVFPANARPHGWSRERMARALALFSTSGNNPADYPVTPFQILSVDPGTAQTVQVDGGIESFGSNTFAVRPDTDFFVPLFFIDDSPPVLGTWPSNHDAAVRYFFEPSLYGGRAFEVVVDGRSTQIGRAYLAGPVGTAPLLDGGGSHIVMLGAFLHPLTPGTHVVSVKGGVFGAELLPTYGVSFVDESLTYTVTVG